MFVLTSSFVESDIGWELSSAYLPSRRDVFQIACAATLSLQISRDMLSRRSQVVEYVTQQLISGYNAGDNTTQSFVNAHDFYIFPIVNPDGELHWSTKKPSSPDCVQVSFTPKRLTACGGRIDSRLQQKRIRRASGLTSTGIGNSRGPLAQVDHPQTPARRHMQDRPRPVPQRTKDYPLWCSSCTTR